MVRCPRIPQITCFSSTKAVLVAVNTEFHRFCAKCAFSIVNTESIRLPAHHAPSSPHSLYSLILPDPYLLSSPPCLSPLSQSVHPHSTSHWHRPCTAPRPTFTIHLLPLPNSPLTIHRTAPSHPVQIARQLSSPTPPVSHLSLRPTERPHRLLHSIILSFSPFALVSPLSS